MDIKEKIKELVEKISKDPKLQAQFRENPVKAVETLLGDRQYTEAAARLGESFRDGSGADGAAAFIEEAPHKTDDMGVLGEVQKRSGLMQLCFWLIITPLLVLLGIHAGWPWAIGLSVIANIAFPKLNQRYTERAYRNLAKARQTKRQAVHPAA